MELLQRYYGVSDIRYYGGTMKVLTLLRFYAGTMELLFTVFQKHPSGHLEHTDTSKWVITKDSICGVLFIMIKKNVEKNMCLCYICLDKQTLFFVKNITLQFCG